jgi:hypothetical protein
VRRVLIYDVVRRSAAAVSGTCCLAALPALPAPCRQLEKERYTKDEVTPILYILCDSYYML